MELNTISLGDFVKLATILWTKGANSVEQAMINSGMVKTTDIPANSGNTREFTEIDRNEYAKYKGEGDQAARGKIQQGLKIAIALVKSLLIDLKTLIKGNKAEGESHRERLNKETLLWEGMRKSELGL
jgi:predicted NUDIX family NTP pyrophosphohydrolase